jgi:hypothetical protein
VMPTILHEGQLLLVDVDDPDTMCPHCCCDECRCCAWEVGDDD